MDTFKHTQFAFMSPNTQGLPSFLVKKLEQSIVQQAMKKQLTKDKLEMKLEKAEKARQEKNSEKLAKVQGHNERVAEIKVQELSKRLELMELRQKMLEKKLEIADLNA